MMAVETVKTCGGPCGLVLPIIEFYKDKDKVDGLQRVCKKCKVAEFVAIKTRNPARAKLAHRLNALRHITRKRYGQSGGLTPDQVIALWHAQGEKCYYCEVPLTIEEISPDHKTPLIRGGTHSMLNIAIACKPCNFSKSDDTEEEFRARPKY
jgi:hypothetical protein